ncbi:MAG TPA: FMN-binding protein [Candidatus Cloacimonadota bacterium]|nr:FMN-binding protein [Candidatus Cloacimonadota bacterium]
MDKTPFTETLYYPILFMIIISVVFVGILAVMFRTSEAKIKANEDNAYQLQIVKLTAKTIASELRLHESDLIANSQDTFKKYIKEDNSQSRKCFVVTASGKELAYCYDIGGNGLWGSMRALVALAPDRSTIIDFAVYSQMETPGLGARIEEEGFRTQFRGKKLLSGDNPTVFSLVPERQATTSDTQIRQITGATITSNSVLRMLKDEIMIIKDQQGTAQ